MAVAYAAIVRRVCGAELRVIGLPGHIVLGVPPPAEEGEEEGAVAVAVSNSSRIFVDPFYGGGILSFDDCRDIVGRYNLTFRDEMADPIPNRMVWERMVRNLIHCHSMQALQDDGRPDDELEWKIAVPLKCFLQSDGGRVSSLEELMVTPGWNPQFC